MVRLIADPNFPPDFPYDPVGPVDRPPPNDDGNHVQRRPPDSKASTFGKKVKIVYLIGVFSLAISIFASDTDKSSSMIAYTNSIMDFKTNWELQPIVDIVIDPNKCPSGYENLIDTRWPGTLEGWDCSGIKGSEKDLKVHTSSSNFNNNKTFNWDDCKFVGATESMPISKIYSYNICAKREGEPFYKAKRPSKSVATFECPKGYTKCGTGSAETQTCVKDGHSCPINDIIITTFAKDIPSGYKSLNLDGPYIAFTNNSTSLPIVRIKLIEGKVCANPAKYQASNGRSRYKLLPEYKSDKWSSKVAGYYTDPRYKKIGKVREDRLFKDNEVDSVVRRLPFYPIADSKLYYWKLYSNSYFKWNSECERYIGIDQAFVLEQAEKSFCLWLVLDADINQMSITWKEENVKRV